MQHAILFYSVLACFGTASIYWVLLGFFQGLQVNPITTLLRESRPWNNGTPGGYVVPGSTYYWACLGLPGRAWACLDLLRFAWVCLRLLGAAWASLDLLGLAWACLDLLGVALGLLVFASACLGLCLGLLGSAWVCLGT